MEVKEAARAAKAYVADVFGDGTSITTVNLEEVKFKDGLPCDRWEITVSYYRESGTIRRDPFPAFLATLGQSQNEPILERVYKVVTVRDADGDVTSVANRMVRDDDD